MLGKDIGLDEHRRLVFFRSDRMFIRAISANRGLFDQFSRFCLAG
jgi:hypothetical protein